MVLLCEFSSLRSADNSSAFFAILPVFQVDFVAHQNHRQLFIGVVFGFQDPFRDVVEGIATGDIVN